MTLPAQNHAVLKFSGNNEFRQNVKIVTIDRMIAETSRNFRKDWKIIIIRGKGFCVFHFDNFWLLIVSTYT